MKNICITGANGFIGRSLCKALGSSGNYIRGFVRNRNLNKDYSEIEYITVGDIGPMVNWKEHLKGCDCIIHCAGKTLKMNDKNLNLYHTVNTESTKHLAMHASEAGVKRIVFLSSIKVNGESSDIINEQKKLYYNDIPFSLDAYAASKLEAENALWEISSIKGLEVVVVRLPLVYGHGVKGNLERLIKLVKSGIPLPLSLVKNQRSMIGVDNLVDLLVHCIDHPEASGKTFLASDGKDLSTPELIKFIASSMGKKANLFPFPISILKFLGSVFGRSEEINRLVGSLRIDNNYTKEILNWTPPVSVEEGIRRMVQEK